MFSGFFGTMTELAQGGVTGFLWRRPSRGVLLHTTAVFWAPRGHSNANLMGSLADRVLDDAIEAEHAEQQRTHGEAPTNVADDR
jgi:hypothetical protein